MNIRKSVLTLTSVALLVFFQTSSVLPPAYLSELNIEVKEISEPESVKAFRKLANNAVIAMKSLSNGGYVYATELGNNIQAIKTLERKESALFLKYTSTTPEETQFVILKNRVENCIVIKSIFMEGKVLTYVPQASRVIFKRYDPQNDLQKWILKSGLELNQVYFQNKATGEFLTIESNEEEQETNQPAPGRQIKITGLVKTEPCMRCKTTEKPTRDELFKITILD